MTVFVLSAVFRIDNALQYIFPHERPSVKCFLFNAFLSLAKINLYLQPCSQPTVHFTASARRWISQKMLASDARVCTFVCYKHAEHAGGCKGIFDKSCNTCVLLRLLMSARDMRSRCTSLRTSQGLTASIARATYSRLRRHVSQYTGLRSRKKLHVNCKAPARGL